MDCEGVRDVWSDPRKVIGFFITVLENAERLSELDSAKGGNIGSERAFGVEGFYFMPGFSSLSKNGDSYK